MGSPTQCVWATHRSPRRALRVTPRVDEAVLLTTMNKIIKFLPLFIVTALWAVLGTGCNTMKGAGKDIEKAGDKIQDAATK